MRERGRYEGELSVSLDLERNEKVGVLIGLCCNDGPRRISKLKAGTDDYSSEGSARVCESRNAAVMSSIQVEVRDDWRGRWVERHELCSLWR